MVRVHFGPPLLKTLNRGQDRGDWVQKAGTPKGTRKAALGNSPVDCCNRRGFPAGKRVLGPPLLKKRKREEEIRGFSSAGRAPALQAGGQRFDPANLHHFLKRSRDWLKFHGSETSLSFLKLKRCTLKTEHCDYWCNLWEGNSKGKLFKLTFKRVTNTILFLNFFYWACIIQLEKPETMDFSTRSS